MLISDCTAVLGSRHTHKEETMLFPVIAVYLIASYLHGSLNLLYKFQRIASPRPASFKNKN